jgi:hypothetical protein
VSHRDLDLSLWRPTRERREIEQTETDALHERGMLELLAQRVAR